MNKRKIVTSGLISGGMLIAIAGGTAMAMVGNQSSNANVGTSGISRKTFRSDRIQAIANVLNVTTQQVDSAFKAKDLKTLVNKANLSKVQFRDQVKAKLTSELESQGYSANQVTIALQHKALKRMHHEERHEKA